MTLNILHIKHKFTDTVFVYQYYQVLRYVVSLIVSVIMVRSALPVADLGQYELVVFLVTSISLFWSAGIKNAMYSWYSTLTEEGRDRLPGQVFWILSIGSLIAAILILLFPNMVCHWFAADMDVSWLPYAALWLVFSVPLILIENTFYLRNETTSLLHYTHWSHGGWLMLTSLVAILSADMLHFIGALIFWAVIRWIYLLWFILGDTIFIFNRRQIGVFLLFSLPLVFQMLLGSAMDFIDGWFVARYFDVSYFPVFKYGARELPFSSLLYSSLSIAMIPWIMDKGIHSTIIREKATNLMHFLVPISIILMILSPFLFPFFYNDNYRDAAFIFNTYLLILTSRVLLPQSFNLALHQHGIVIWSGIVEIICNVALSYWWLVDFGVYGLAMATVVSYLVQKIILVVYNYRVNGLTLSNYIDLRYYVLYCILLTATYLMTFNIFK